MKKKFDRTDGLELYWAGMQTLFDAGHGIHRQDIFKGVEQRVTLKPDDWHENKSNHEPYWKMRVGLNLWASKEAGYVQKLGEGMWRITASGKAYMLTPEFQSHATRY